MTPPEIILMQFQDESVTDGDNWRNWKYIRYGMYQALFADNVRTHERLTALQAENAELHTKLADARKDYDALMADSVGR